MAIKLDDDMKTRVRRLAEARQRTSHWLMREAFCQETLKAWEDFQANGLHVTAGEADAWLAQLEQGNDIGPPACHE
ncbi:CopG family ribbon-helix-helix protein [Herbaspirillum seropedicae]|uniref:CopG family ribbon-helix-helix protein n=1 Tax=Herbaspirillum seropedicae TaxID=964 RepID=UPI0023EA9F55|nr:ribbon-helix-helix protein, CopG family [Herbaspirillum seropedicae]